MKKFLILFQFILAAALFAAVKEVKVSDFNPRKDDATNAVQKALNSKAQRVIFENLGYPYLVRPLKLRSNQELIFQDGVIIQAKPGEYKNKGECMITGTNVSNIKMIGQGKVILRMNKSDYLNRKLYIGSEYRNAIALRGCSNVLIKNMEIRESGGDGLYIAAISSKKAKPSTNITVENVIFDHNLRQGISVICVHGLTIRNCVFSNTKGGAPEGGIDFEPNNPKEGLTGILMENCKFFNNDKGILFNFQRRMDGRARPTDIIIRNCESYNNRKHAFSIGAGIGSAESAFKGSVLVENCVFRQKKGDIVALSSFRNDGMKITFRNCRIESMKGNKGNAINIGPGTDRPVGNIDFGNMTIINRGPGEAFRIFPEPISGVEKLEGNITINGKKFDLDKYCSQFVIDKDRLAYRRSKKLPKSATPAASGSKTRTSAIRGRFVTLQYATAGEPVKLNWESRPYHYNNLIKGNLVVTAPSGKKVDNYKFEGKASSETGGPRFSYTIIPEETGLYKVEFINKFCTILSSDAKAWGISTVGYPYPGPGISSVNSLPFFRCGGKYTIVVPPEAQKVEVMVSASVTEPVGAELIDAGGKSRVKYPANGKSHLLKVVRKPAKNYEFWTLKLFDADEDYSISLGDSLPPVIFTSPDNAFINIE